MRLRAAATAVALIAFGTPGAGGASPVAAPAQRTYAAADLGTLGGKTAVAIDVNAFGDVVGYSTTQQGAVHAFLWSRGAMTDLRTLGGRTSVANAVSDTGVVVGESHVAGSDAYHAFVWTRRSGMLDLGTLGGAESYANDVNDAGLVVGTSLGTDDAPHAFAWTSRAGMLPLKGGLFSTASGAAASVSGPIAGSAGLPFVPGQWRSRTRSFSPFKLPAGDAAGQSSASDARGDVVGTLQTAEDLVQPFLRLPRRAAADLGTPAGFAQAEANGISNSRRVAGVAYDDPLGVSVAWLRRGRRTEVLGDLVAPGSRWLFRTASAIDDRGEIVGTGTIGGLTHAFVLRRAWPSRSRACGGSGSAGRRSAPASGGRSRGRSRTAPGRARRSAGSRRRRAESARSRGPRGRSWRQTCAACAARSAAPAHRQKIPSRTPPRQLVAYGLRETSEGVLVYDGSVGLASGSKAEVRQGVEEQRRPIDVEHVHRRGERAGKYLAAAGCCECAACLVTHERRRGERTSRRSAACRRKKRRGRSSRYRDGDGTRTAKATRRVDHRKPPSRRSLVRVA